ncbi:MAG: type II toxin-antitoxin system HipA family toxin [Alphaproteobacteria bacterium]
MRLNVFLNQFGSRSFVGVLDDKDTNRIFFEYNPSFLKQNINLSPFKLPLNAGVLEDSEQTFAGLYGLFNDSLPDGWGCLLLDRKLQKQGLSINEITPLKRLAMIGTNAMGALEYEPIIENNEYIENKIELDKLHIEANKILEGQSSEVLQELLTLNGSSQGARPKVLVNVSSDKKQISQSKGSPWLIKFASSLDNKNIGAVEYIYSILAKQSGIEMPETYLFESKINAGHFGVQRFDRIDGNKIHIHTACGLLHASHRTASLDYTSLLKLTSVLTKDAREVEKMFRLMIFNVLSGNKDDHSKNFSFMIDKNNNWKLTPAYDLTPSQGINGEQTAMVNNKGKDIADADFIKTGLDFSISKETTQTIIEQTKDALSNYNKLAKEFGVEF